MLSLSKILELFRQCGICFSVYYIYIICRKSEINHHLKKRGGVRLFLRTQTCPLSEMVWSCKCFQQVSKMFCRSLFVLFLLAIVLSVILCLFFWLLCCLSFVLFLLAIVLFVLVLLAIMLSVLCPFSFDYCVVCPFSFGFCVYSQEKKDKRTDNTIVK
jgi:hypothetical protein